MAQKQILKAVTLGEGDVYLPGMEDQLEDAITKDELERLTELGAISGPFKAKARSAENRTTTAAAATEGGDTEVDAKENEEAVVEQSKTNASMAPGATPAKGKQTQKPDPKVTEGPAGPGPDLG